MLLTRYFIIKINYIYAGNTFSINDSENVWI